MMGAFPKQRVGASTARGEYALSPVQERMVMGRALAQVGSSEAPTSTVLLGLRQSGDFALPIVLRALNEIVRRHPCLAVSIVPNPTIPASELRAGILKYGNGAFDPGFYVQRPIPGARVTVRRIALSHMDPTGRDTEFRSIVQEERLRPFDYQTPPLMRGTLVEFGDREHVLLVSVDHIVSDGWSLRIISREFKALYECFTSGNRDLPNEAPVSYLDYVEWQHETNRNGCFAREATYWREKWRTFASQRIAVRDLPFAVQTGEPSLRQEDLSTSFSLEESQSLRAFSCQRKVTLYMCFLAAFAILMRLYIGREQIAIWTYCYNRVRPEIQNVIGYFVNRHLIGLDVNSNLSAAALLHYVRAVVCETMTHQEMPLDFLWQMLRCRPRFFDANVNLGFRRTDQTVEEAGTPLLGQGISDIKLPVTNLPGVTGLGVLVEDNGLTLSMHCRYSADRYPEGAIEQMLRDLRAILTEMVQFPEAAVSRYSTLIHQWPQPRSTKREQMGEFILLNSDLIPEVHVARVASSCRRSEEFEV